MDLVSIVLAELEWYRKSYLVKSLSAVLCASLLVNICGIRIKSLYSDKRYRGITEAFHRHDIDKCL